MERNLTEGNIGKSLIIFSLPMILGNLLQQLYNVADTMIVGKLIGPAALAAVGSSYALMVLITSVILGLCMGSGVVFAQLYGAGKFREMKVSIYNAAVLLLIITIILFALSEALLEPIIRWLHIPEESIADTSAYLAIIFRGILFVSIYNLISSILRSMGNTVAALVFLGISSVVNIVLDLLFVAVFHMGVSGAALATVISQGVSAVMITLYFFRRAKEYCPSKKEMYLDGQIMRPIVSNSFLTAIQQSIMNFGILMVQGLVNSFGYEASAAFAAVVKIDAFAYMPAQDFGNAFATFVAQNFGAGKEERIRKGLYTSIVISSAFCIAASAVVTVCARYCMRFFINETETRIMAIGIQYLHIEGAFYIGIGILFLWYAYFRGIGKPSISILLTIISLGTRVVLAYALAGIPAVGMVGIWWAVPVGWFLADFAGGIAFLRKGKHQSQE